MKCRWCQEKLMVGPAGGMVHLDGKAYRQRELTQSEVAQFVKRHGREPSEAERVVDDHVALAVGEGRPKKN